MPGEWTDQIARVEQMQKDVAGAADWYAKTLPVQAAECRADADALAALLGIVAKAEGKAAAWDALSAWLLERKREGNHIAVDGVLLKMIEFYQLATPRSGQE